MKYRNLIFDLDGTISDSRGDVVVNLQKAYADFSLSFDVNKLVIGPTLYEIIKILTPDITEELSNNILTRFRDYYHASTFKNSFLYPHIKNIMDACKKGDCLLFVATNKPKEGTALLLKHLGVDSLFTATMSPNTFPDRIINKTEMIEYILHQYQLKKAETIMIGDAVTDIIAGKNAGIDTAAHLNGYERASELKLANPTFVFESFDHFSHFIFQ